MRIGTTSFLLPLVCALAPACGGSNGATTLATAGASPRPPAEHERAIEAGTGVAPDPPNPEPPSPEPAEADPEPRTGETDVPPETARSRGHADLDPDNDDIIGPPDPLPDCEDRLAAAGVTFKPARIGLGKKRNGVYTCGAAQVVRYKKGPGNIRYSSAPLLTCPMALALVDLEAIVQEEAERLLGSRVVRIDHLGTYNCRDMALYDLISEHSFANGFDLRKFHLANGKIIDVLTDFRPTETEPTRPETLFLRRVANRLYDEDVFSVVVTPFFDRAHRNHLHVDLARYRVDGSRGP